MNDPKPPEPTGRVKRLTELLREQNMAEDEIQTIASSLLRLDQFQAPLPSSEETRKLIDELIPYLPAPQASPIRQALRARSHGLAAELRMLLQLIQTQISLFHASFWLASSIIVLLGALFISGGPALNPVFLLQIIGPLLSYLGTASAFRGQGLYMLEFELACPPSPRQLTLARLVIVLCYDIGLGLLLSCFLSSTAGFAFWPITLHWLAPLLLGAGLTLLLSLRLPISQAAVIGYVSWLALLVGSLLGRNALQSTISAFSFPTELVFSLAGILMLGAAVAFIPRSVIRMLPGK